MISGSEFVVQGAEHKGLYVEDENNFDTIIQQPDSAYLTSYYVEDEDNFGNKLGERYNDDVDVYTRSNGVYCYTVTEVNPRLQGEPYEYNGSLYRKTNSGTYLHVGVNLYRYGNTKTYYTISNGAKRYSTSLVETPLYKHGGTYPMYKKVSKTLFASGKSVSIPKYKVYGGKVYDPGKKYSIQPAEFEIETVTALTV